MFRELLAAAVLLSVGARGGTKLQAQEYRVTATRTIESSPAWGDQKSQHRVTPRISGWMENRSSRVIRQAVIYLDFLSEQGTYVSTARIEVRGIRAGKAVPFQTPNVANAHSFVVNRVEQLE